MDKLRAGFACLARLTFDGEYARRLFEESAALLDGLGIELVRPPDLTVTEEDARAAAGRFAQAGVDAVLIQFGTFPLGSLVPAIAQGVPAPLVLWGVPEPVPGAGRLRSNSLCALNMNTHALMRLGRPYDFLFAAPGEAAGELRRILRVLDCLRRLKSVRLGLVGYRVPGFYASVCDEFELRRKFGVELHHVDLAEVWEAARKADAPGRQREAAAFRAGAASISVDDREIDEAAALYLGFKTVIARHKLDALAVKCWPEFPNDYGIAACATLGRLNAEGILASCEGDVYGAVTMLIEHYLTGALPMFADFVAIDEEHNTGIGWHCGAAPASLAAADAQVALARHPTAGGGGKKGVIADFPLRDQGPVTMARVGVGPHGLRLFLAGGEAARTGRILCGNTLAVRFSVPVRKLLDTILREGVEHHFALVHADILAELSALARWVKVDVIQA